MTMQAAKQICPLWPDCECQPESPCRARPCSGSHGPAPQQDQPEASSPLARIIHPPVDGEHLARRNDPLRITPAGRIMLASLAIAMMGTLAALILRSLAHAETAYQLASRV